MHYYPFHIGDYRSSTAHLSNEEDLAYRRLIDMYMDTEKPIPDKTEWVARRLRVGSEVVSVVLHDFFELLEDGWHHDRCQEEIAKYHHQVNVNRINGAKGGRPKKNPVGSQSQPNGKATKNHEPRSKNQEPKIIKPTDVSDQVWKDFIEHRKKAKAPLTSTALSRIIKEAQLADWTLNQVFEECVLRGWRGFKAEWVNTKRPGEKQTRGPVENWGTMEDL
jgi:uncharacterized protein YdaU (DUF1376 family)